MLAQDRRNRLRAAMNEAGIEALVVYGNAWQSDYLRYVADFSSLEGHGIAVMAPDGAVELFVDSAAEAERAAAETSGIKVSLAPEIAREVAGRLERIANHRIAAAPLGFMPKFLADQARGYQLEDGTKLVDHLLMVKLPAEIEALRQAAKLADQGYEIFKQAARPGRKQFELIADVEGFFRRQGCADNFMIMGSGGKDVFAMAPPSDRRIAAGDMVTTELTPAVHGYFAQICRTMVLGKANDAQKRAHGVYREAMEAGIAAVRPGATAAQVAKAENDVFRKYGLGDYVTNKYTRVRGHGLGLFTDTKPHILEDVDTVLEAGMVIIVHPNTYHPETGYMVLGDTVVVTPTGAEVLTGTPREIFEV
ncbi:MAG TPA: Xaa-Pro peptidase family protein [Stellaceae bacterium]|jgi:Xaa-Pro aminopeptidase|nr:Xaa-Pro peptidase family protein [Stellaceae bacterium]